MTHLRQAMLEELHRRNYAASTITYYVKNVEQFARYFRRSPDRLNQTHLRTYQAYLLRERKLAPRTVKLHVCAIRFFFNKILRRRYSSRRRHIRRRRGGCPRSVLTVEEVQRLIAAARSLTDRTMLMVLYSTGMRNAELRIYRSATSIVGAMLIHIRHGKGGRDRYVPLSAALLATLREHWRWMRPRTYLFPGPCTTGAPTSRSRRRSSGMPADGGPPRRPHETGLAPHAAPFVRHASARSWRRPPHDSAAARPRRGPAHGAVSPPLPAALAGGRQSARGAGDSRAGDRL